MFYEDKIKLTENEIVDFLKENKNKGVIFAFMPEEVQAWCGDHSSLPVFQMFDAVKGWTEKGIISCYLDKVYCLVEDYDPNACIKD